MTLSNTLSREKVLRCFIASLVVLTFALSTWAKSAESQGKPLAKADVVRLLRAKLPEDQLAAQIRKHKISFPVTASAIQDLKAAGASRRVLEALRDAQPVGLVWSSPTRTTLSQNMLVETTPLVVDSGHEYFACTTDEKHVNLVTNAGGSWKAYPVAPNLYVGNDPGDRVIGLAVHQGVAYIAMVPNGSSPMQLLLAYNPGGNPAGPWILAPVYSTDSSVLENPSAAVAGDNLLVAFDDMHANKGSNDVFLGTIPLSKLDAKGKVPPASLLDLSQADDHPQGPSDKRPQLVSSQGQINIVWEQADKNALFGQAPFASVDHLQTQVVQTVNDPMDKSLQLAARGNTTLVGRFAQNPDHNDALGCCDVFATTNAGGSWSTSSVGRTSLALEGPGLAIGDCGPSVAYVRFVKGVGGRLTVATFADGQWHSQELAAEQPDQPRLAATASGLYLVYISGVGQITARSATCYPAPAPLK